MKTLVWILPLIIILISATPMAIAQNTTANPTGNTTESGGMSSESVESAQSNTNNNLTTNATGNTTDSGGMSSESVEMAQSNTNNNLTTNATGNTTGGSGGMSSESVEMAQ